MDPTHYEKIADRLMQFRGKIPKELELYDRVGICAAAELKNKIDDLLWQINRYAEQDAKGWIR